MPEIRNQIDPGRRARGASDPGEITLPPPSGEQRRIAGMLARLKEFGARLSAHGRWMKAFLHNGR